MNELNSGDRAPLRTAIGWFREKPQRASEVELDIDEPTTGPATDTPSRLRWDFLSDNGQRSIRERSEMALYMKLGDDASNVFDVFAQIEASQGSRARHRSNDVCR